MQHVILLHEASTSKDSARAFCSISHHRNEISRKAVDRQFTQWHSIQTVFDGASNKHPFLLRHRTKPFLQRYRQQQIWLSFLYKPTYQRGPLWLSFCFWVTCTEIKISFAQHQALEQAGQVSSDRELGARWGCWQAVLRPTHILYICPEGVHVTVWDSFKCCFWHRFTCLNWSEYFDGKN